MLIRTQNPGTTHLLFKKDEALSARLPLSSSSLVIMTCLANVDIHVIFVILFIDMKLNQRLF